MSAEEAAAGPLALSRSDYPSIQRPGVSRPAGPSTWEGAFPRETGGRALEDRDVHRLHVALAAQAAACPVRWRDKTR